MKAEAPITAIDVSAYRIPTDAPEADGTLSWTSTSLVAVEVSAGDKTGFGYTYSDASAAALIHVILAPAVLGKDAFHIPQLHQAMLRQVRNIGRAGLAATAISAVDTALWDLKARLLHVSLRALFGAAREAVPIYGSGGFTSYDDERLQSQLGAWASDGCRFVKMKVGADPARDMLRVKRASEAIAGTGAALFVDANGAYALKQALAFAAAFASLGVAWFEEPVSSDDLAGLRMMRDGAPPGMEIAAGEYGYDAFYFRAMLEAGAVDVLQADVTRCLGYTGLFAADALAAAFATPLSLHCAPSLHLPAAHALTNLRHQEWFHDHVRIEHMLFEGAPQPVKGMIAADPDRPGHGLTLKVADAKRFAI